MGLSSSRRAWVGPASDVEEAKAEGLPGRKAVVVYRSRAIFGLIKAKMAVQVYGAAVANISPTLVSIAHRRSDGDYIITSTAGIPNGADSLVVVSLHPRAIPKARPNARHAKRPPTGSPRHHFSPLARRNTVGDSAAPGALRPPVVCRDRSATCDGFPSPTPLGCAASACTGLGSTARHRKDAACRKRRRVRAPLPEMDGGVGDSSAEYVPAADAALRLERVDFASTARQAAGDAGHGRALPIADKEVRVMVMGSKGVGKTSLLRTFHTGTFDSKVKTTIGMENDVIGVSLGPAKIKFHMLDTAGDRRVFPYLSNHVTGRDAALIVFDITDRDSYEAAVTRFYRLVRDSPMLDRHLVVLVGNKRDLAAATTTGRGSDLAAAVDPTRPSRAVTRVEAADTAADLGVPYYETSALSASSAMRPFQYLASQLVNEYPDELAQSVQRPASHVDKPSWCRVM